MEQFKPGPKLVPKLAETEPSKHDPEQVAALEKLLRAYEDRVSGKSPSLTAQILGPMGLDITKTNRELKERYSAAIIRYFLKHGSVEDDPQKVVGPSYVRSSGDQAIAWRYAWEDMEAQIKRITG